MIQNMSKPRRASIETTLDDVALVFAGGHGAPVSAAIA
jgi:hypothetical protein